MIKYTDGHPDVLGVRRALTELEEQKRQLVAARRSDGAPQPQASASAGGGGQRAYELLKVSLAQAEAAAASLRIRVAEYSDRYNRLKESARMVPQVEAEFAQLNRDYEVNKKNYEVLIGRRESASISSDMQTVSGVADFRVIDPPRVSPRPIFPNRLTYLVLNFLVALGAGFAAAFVATELRPTFFDGRSLRDATGLPLLGTVSAILNSARRRQARRSTIRFLGGAGALVGAYALGMIAWVLLSVRTV